MPREASVPSKGLFESVFGSAFGRHEMSCPCGASLSTDDKALAQVFVERHTDHVEPPPKTHTA
jgi:hypothetical protein